MDTHLSLLTDLYQLTMMQGYLSAGHEKEREVTVFDLFYRVNPSGNGFVLAAGLQQVIDYMDHLHFTEEDVRYLKELGLFDEAFLDAIRAFRFTGDIHAVPEGTVVFPGEPIVRVKAPIFEAQLLETALLTLINHSSLIATKTSRVVRAAHGRAVLEFGARRAQGADAAVYGARAAWIAGAAGTSNVLAGQRFGIPVVGTHAHSWVQSFPTEREAFSAFAQAFPNHSVLLVDTYDVLRSGVPNAIETARELKAKGHTLRGIRIDSGDLAYLSKRARQMLDDAGFPEVQIVASSDLDEYVIQDLLVQGAQIDSFGVGTNMITSADSPALGGVYKLAATVEDGKFIPRIKISENPAKVTTPGYKQVYRLYEQPSGKATADLITYADEGVPQAPMEIFDPAHTWKRRVVHDFTARALLEPIYLDGRRVYEQPSLDETRSYAKSEMDSFWDEVKRLRNPYEYHVDLSQRLWDERYRLIQSLRE